MVTAAASIVEDLAERYTAAGVGVGHRIALGMDNHPAFFPHLLAGK